MALAVNWRAMPCLEFFRLCYVYNSEDHKMTYYKLLGESVFECTLEESIENRETRSWQVGGQCQFKNYIVSTQFLGVGKHRFETLVMHLDTLMLVERHFYETYRDAKEGHTKTVLRVREREIKIDKTNGMEGNGCN